MKKNCIPQNFIMTELNKQYLNSSVLGGEVKRVKKKKKRKGEREN